MRGQRKSLQDEREGIPGKVRTLKSHLCTAVSGCYGNSRPVDRS